MQHCSNSVKGKQHPFPCLPALHSDWLTTVASHEQVVLPAVHHRNRNHHTQKKFAASKNGGGAFEGHKSVKTQDCV